MIQESSKLTFTMPSTCDCNVIVYAVSDRHSFGKLKVLMINIYVICNFPPSLDIAVSLLSRLFKNGRESGRDKRVILVGNKTDLARNREVSSKVKDTQGTSIVLLFCSAYLQEGRNTAILYGSKFIETGAGIGHNIDQLLVGIVLQSRFIKFSNCQALVQVQRMSQQNPKLNKSPQKRKTYLDLH